MSGMGENKKLCSPTTGRLLLELAAQASSTTDINQVKDQGCASLPWLLSSFFCLISSWISIIHWMMTSWLSEPCEVLTDVSPLGFTTSSHSLSSASFTSVSRPMEWLSGSSDLSLCLWKHHCPHSVHESKGIMTKPENQGTGKGLVNILHNLKEGSGIEPVFIAIRFLLYIYIFLNLLILSHILNCYIDFNFESLGRTKPKA